MARILLSLFVIAAMAPRDARATEISCDLVQPGVIAVDGLLDDWQGVGGTRLQGSSGKDAAVTVRCNYDESTLYLSFDVADDTLVRRGKKEKGAEDTLALRFGKQTLEVSPADEHGRAHVVRWAGGGSLKGIAEADSLQPRGWSVELSLPRARVPGWHKGVTTLAFDVELRDADMFSENGFQETVSAGDGSLLVLEEGASLYKQFLEDNHLSAKDIWLDQMANMDGEPGLERVVVGGRTLGILGEKYYFMTFPVPRKDVLEVKLVDLAGGGKPSILVRYVERGSGGSREVLGVWSLLPDGSFAHPFAHEVAKEGPGGRITDVWTLEPKTEKKGKRVKKLKGFDIVITPGESRGYTKDTWNESPAEDMTPILLPWEKSKKERWRFEGDECSGGPE